MSAQPNTHTPSPGPVTLSVFTENHIGLLARVTAAFTRRTINIESLTVSESEIPGIHRFTIVVDIARDQAQRIALQLERQIEVIAAVVHDDSELVCRDLALYKIDSAAQFAPGFAALLASHEAQVLEQHAEYLVVQKAGTQQQTAALLRALGPYGVLEFVRSGRIALTRPMKRLTQILRELDATRRAAAQSTQE